jgi:hypothetical protein
VRPQVLGPTAPHDVEPLLEDLPVARFGLGPITARVDDVVVLAEHAAGPRLIAAGEPDVQSAAGQVVGDRDVFREPQWVPVGQHQGHLAVP